MFSKQQLQLLIDAQSGDDWSPLGFIKRLPEVREQSDIIEIEFDELIAMLQQYSYGEIADMQVALTILGNLQ